MPPKRPSHLDEPPAASSSEEAEEASSEEEEEDEEEEDPSEDEPEKTPKKASALASKPQASESGSGSSSESEPDDSAVKPLASKPMEEAATAPAKPKKPRSKPVATPAKRQAESEPAKGSKRAKKKGSDAAAGAENNGPAPAPAPAPASAASEDAEPKKLGGGGGDEKKLFQRLWSEDDEIVILKGMIDYAAKKGSDPSADMGAFLDFIKKSLHIDFSKSQLTDKVRRLRKKYENNSSKKKYDPSKPHEKKAFELSKKIWGGSGSGSAAADEPRSNGTAVRTASRSNGKTLASLKTELLSSPEPAREAEKVGMDGSGGGGVGGLEGEICGFDKSLPEYVVRQGLGMVSEEKKADLEAKWKKLHVAELELFVKRTQLMSEQGNLILEALKSSDH